MTSTGFRAFFPTNAPNPLHPILPNMRLNNTDPRSKIEPNFGPFSLPPMVHPVGSQNNQSEDEEVTTSNINSHGASSNFNSETLNQMSSVDQGNESGEHYYISKLFFPCILSKFRIILRNNMQTN